MAIKCFIHLILTFTIIFHPYLHAGSRQATEAESIIPLERVIPFAKRVEKYAASQGARVFVLSRLGTPRSEMPKGVAYTHVGLAVYSEIQTENGEKIKGYAIYNLYQDTNRPEVSNLAIDYPVDFFAGAVELSSGMLIPVPKLQRKLLNQLEKGSQYKLHNAQYSIVSNPYTTRFQNCTEHLLDVLFASIYDTDSIAQIKANQRAYFVAKRIKLSPFKRLLAPIFEQSIDLSDHGKRIKVATFTTIARFMLDNQLAENYAVLSEDSVEIVN